jgi:hypothetical protein
MCWWFYDDCVDVLVIVNTYTSTHQHNHQHINTSTQQHNQHSHQHSHQHNHQHINTSIHNTLHINTSTQPSTHQHNLHNINTITDTSTQSSTRQHNVINTTINTSTQNPRKVLCFFGPLNINIISAPDIDSKHTTLNDVWGCRLCVVAVLIARYLDALCWSLCWYARRFTLLRCWNSCDLNAMRSHDVDTNPMRAA